MLRVTELRKFKTSILWINETNLDRLQLDVIFAILVEPIAERENRTREVGTS